MLDFAIMIAEPICASIDLELLDLALWGIDFIKYQIYGKDRLVEQRTRHWVSGCLPRT